jgi:hypothetical protein
MTVSFDAKHLRTAACIEFDPPNQELNGPRHRHKLQIASNFSRLDFVLNLNSGQARVAVRLVFEEFLPCEA